MCLKQFYVFYGLRIEFDDERKIDVIRNILNLDKTEDIRRHIFFNNVFIDQYYVFVTSPHHLNCHSLFILVSDVVVCNFETDGYENCLDIDPSIYSVRDFVGNMDGYGLWDKNSFKVWVVNN